MKLLDKKPEVDSVQQFCERHGAYMANKIVLFEGREMLDHCPKCVEERQEKIRQEEEYESIQKAIYRRKEFLRKANIEPMYYESTLDNYIAESEEQKQALNSVNNLAETKKGKVILLGKNGTGKTHLAVGAIQKMGGAIYTMFEIVTRIRSTYSKGSDFDEIEILEELADIPLLVIDEIGRTKGSDAESNWLSYIIDKRHVRFKPLILISNRHTKKTCIQKGCDQCLENFMDSDVLSRISEDGILITFTGEDYRKTKRNKK